VGSTSSTSTTTTTIPVRLWEGTERLNVLLLGGDAGVGRSGVRTDTIILASLDATTGDVGLFAVPRTIAQVPLPESLGIWACDCFPAIINELWDYGVTHPERFAGARPPGAAALISGMEEMLGIPIHHFALVNLDGFVDLIDAIGGVEITVTEHIYDSAYPNEDGTTEVIDWAPGTYEMNGHRALQYVRTRQGSDDYNRMGRQRCLLQAVSDQADPVTIARSFSDITNTIKKNLLTDIPLERLPDLIQIISKLDPDRIVAVGFVPPEYTGPRTADLYNTPDLDAIRHAVATVLELPAAEAIAALGLEPFSSECS
jgi:LCP family protein required for cell wall assembly